MEKVFIICSVVLLAILASVQAIFRGENVKDRTLVPWFAQVESIKFNGDEILCGGTIIKPWAILTNFQPCLGDNVPAKTVAYVGYLNYKLGKIAISKTIPNSDYDQATNANNIAILITEKRLIESPTIKSATLAVLRNPYSDIDANIYGLGMKGLSDYSDVIQVAKTKTRWNGLTTLGMYGSTLVRPNDMVIEKSKSDLTGAMCDGDMGGPVMVGDVVVGVYKDMSGDKNCDIDPNTDEATLNYCVFERVTKHLSWINNVTSINVVA